MFPFTRFEISEWYVKMLSKVGDNNRPFKAEQYGERIMEIGVKLRKLWLFKASHYII